MVEKTIKPDIRTKPFTLFLATIILFSPNFLFFIPIFNSGYIIFMIYNFFLTFVLLSGLAQHKWSN